MAHRPISSIQKRGTTDAVRWRVAGESRRRKPLLALRTPRERLASPVPSIPAWREHRWCGGSEALCADGAARGRGSAAAQATDGSPCHPRIQPRMLLSLPLLRYITAPRLPHPSGLRAAWAARGKAQWGSSGIEEIGDTRVFLEVPAARMHR